MADDQAIRVVDVVPARVQQKGIMENLFQYYLHDFSQYVDLEIDDQGRFEDPHLPDYWGKDHRFPFFITTNAKIAGFVLVTRNSKGDGQPVFDISEFFVLRAYRRQGIGKQAACKMWDRFPGNWRVRVMRRNRPAVAFWDTILRETVGGTLQRRRQRRGGYEWFVYRFTSLA